MSAKLVAFKIKDWKQISDKDFCYQGEDRPAVRIGIGEMQQPDETKQFIIEPFYKDILPYIDDKVVTVHIDIYSEPMIVLEANGRLIIHNANVKLLKEETLEALENKVVSVGNQLRSLSELRNNINAKSGIGSSTRALREVLSDGLNKKVNYDFIRLILKEMYNHTDDSDLSNEMLSLTNEELVCLHAGLMEKKLTNGANLYPLIKLLADYQYEEIEKAYQEEVTRRFFEGGIR